MAFIKKSRLLLPKMFETQSKRCPINLFQKHLSKRPVGMEKSEPFYLQPTVNTWSDAVFKVPPPMVEIVILDDGTTNGFKSYSQLRALPEIITTVNWHTARRT